MQHLPYPQALSLLEYLVSQQYDSNQLTSFCNPKEWCHNICVLLLLSPMTTVLLLLLLSPMTTVLLLLLLSPMTTINICEYDEYSQMNDCYQYL